MAARENSLFCTFIRILLIAAIITHQTGCASSPKQPDDRPKAYLFTWLHAYRYEVPERTVNPEVYVDGGDKPDISPIKLSPGRHKLKVLVSWAGEFSDENQMAFNAVGGHHYGLGVYQFKQGEKPEIPPLSRATPPVLVNPADGETGTTSEESTADKLRTAGQILMIPLVIAGAGVMAFVYGSALIVTFPFWMYEILSEEGNTGNTAAANGSSVRKGRPFEDCCFIWIEDFATHQVVAGAKPPEQAAPLVPAR